MRLIDADALRKNAWKAEQFNPDMLVVGLGFVLDAPTIAPPDWTPCAEGLPDVGKDVLITYNANGIYNSSVGFMGKSKRWYLTDEEQSQVEVLAWQPLPEPWTGGLDGKEAYAVDIRGLR